MKGKDYIEEIILNNLEGLGDNEPPVGHLDRFEAKLKLQNKKKKITMDVAWKVAAAVVFVLLAANQIVIYLSPGKTGNGPTNKGDSISLASVAPEYREVECYYTNAIDAGLTQWGSLSNDGFISEEEQGIMDAELADFNKQLAGLQEDLASNPHDERVINAMLEYYRAKLNVISMIVSKLEEAKQQQQNTENENEIEM